MELSFYGNAVLEIETDEQEKPRVLSPEVIQTFENSLTKLKPEDQNRIIQCVERLQEFVQEQLEHFERFEQKWVSDDGSECGVGISTRGNIRLFKGKSYVDVLPNTENVENFFSTSKWAAKEIMLFDEHSEQAWGILINPKNFEMIGIQIPGDEQETLHAYFSVNEKWVKVSNLFSGPEALEKTKLFAHVLNWSFPEV